MKYLVFFLLSLFIQVIASSCSSIKDNLAGQYYATYGKNYFYSIRLNDVDSTFEYESNSYIFRGKYNGTWTISNDSVFLHFPYSNNPIEQLKKYSLHNRTLKFKINRRNLYYPFIKLKFHRTKSQSK